MAKKADRMDKLLPYLAGLIVFLLFLPSVWHGFINMDDLPLLRDHWLTRYEGPNHLALIFKSSLYGPHYKPLVYVSWVAEKAVFGEINPHVIHFNNVLLHAVNTVLVYLLSLRLMPYMWPGMKRIHLAAFLCALAWGCHPMRIESVAWAIERKDVLFALFYLLGCLAYFKHITSKRRWQPLVIATVCYLAACCSKSMGVTFFATAVLMEFLVTGKEAIRVKGLISKVPLLIVLLLALHLYGYFLAPEQGGTRVVNSVRNNAYVPDAVGGGVAGYVAITNLRLVGFALHTVFPYKLAIVYPRELWISTLGIWIYALLAVPLFFIALLYLRRQQFMTNIGFGIAWFVIASSPVLVAEGTGTNFLSDRYMYIPSLGLVWILIPGLIKVLPKSVGRFRMGEVVSMLCIVALCTVTTVNLRNWRNSISLWEDMIEKYPKNWYGYYNRAKLLVDTDPEQALADLNRGIDHLPNQGMMYYARGTIYMNSGNQAQALADFDRALQLDPEDGESLINRGGIHRDRKQYDLAVADYTKAAERKKFRDKALNNRALTYRDMGNIQAALNDLNTCITEFPRYANAYTNRAGLYVRNDIARYADAIADYDKFLKLRPKAHEALFRRGYAYAQLGNHANALQDMNDAIGIEPGIGFYFFGRAATLEALGRPKQALADYQKASAMGVRVDPAVYNRLR